MKKRQHTYCNAHIIPFHYEHSSPLWVKKRTIGGSAPLHDATTGIVIYQSIAFRIVFTIPHLNVRTLNSGHCFYSSTLTSTVPVKSAVGFKRHPIKEYKFRVSDDSVCYYSPGPVWKATWLCSLSWTPSIISISPVYETWALRKRFKRTNTILTYGQFPEPRVQKAGHTPKDMNMNMHQSMVPISLTAAPRCLLQIKNKQSTIIFRPTRYANTVKVVNPIRHHCSSNSTNLFLGTPWSRCVVLSPFIMTVPSSWA